jgi:hypothetical protein
LYKIQQATMLCETCLRIFQGPLDAGFHVHRTVPEDMEIAAIEGCYICDIAWENLLSKRREAEQKTYDISESISLADEEIAMGELWPFCVYQVQDGSQESMEVMTVSLVMAKGFRPSHEEGLRSSGCLDDIYIYFQPEPYDSQ